jgi:hypothetical protein
MKFWRLFSALAITAAGCGSGDSVALDVQVIIPADVPTIDAGVLYLSLWSYDPGIADVAATLVDRDVASFSHITGQASTAPMRVAGRVADPQRHYISVEGCAGTSEDWRRVLWDGIEGVAAPRVVEMRYLGTGGGSCSVEPPDS